MLQSATPITSSPPPVT